MVASSKLYKDELIIDMDLVYKHGDPEAFEGTRTPEGQSTGYFGNRRRTAFGQEKNIPAYGATLIPESEWIPRIQEMQELGSSISQRMIKAKVPCKDQKSTNFCWIFSTVSAYEIARMLQGETFIEFSPGSVGSIITNGRNVGGWCSGGIQGIDKYGLAPASMYPNTQTRKVHTREILEAMKVFDVPEWREVQPGNKAAFISAGLAYKPIAAGYNHWSHAIVACEPIILDGEIVYRFRNSWGASYGSNGFFVMRGWKMIPDDAILVNSVSPAGLDDINQRANNLSLSLAV